jgi:hypothetical protein
MSVIREQGLDLEALGLNREELQRRLRQPRNRRYPDAPEQLPAQPLAYRQVLRQRLNEQTRAAANRICNALGERAGHQLLQRDAKRERFRTNAVNFAVFAGQCLSSGKGVAALMFWMTHCGLIQRR